jgi:hemerythrin-like metal-binding protein
MEKIVWHEEDMSTGYDNIDSQHRFIVNAFNVLQDSIEENRSGEIISIMFEAFEEHIKNHFRDEEIILKKKGSLTKEHKKEHSDFKKKIKTFKNKLKSKDIYTKDPIIYGLLIYLKDWIYSHFMETDLKSLKD